MTPDRSIALNKRIYRSMLLVYPRAFRQVYGADMVQVFGDRLRQAREDAGRRAGFVIWCRTLLDLFKTAPVQRMERAMSREATFAILFAVLLTVAVAFFVMGVGGLAINVGIGVLILAAIALGVSGVFNRKRAAGDQASKAAGKLGARDWWVVLAGVIGVLELGFGIAQLIADAKIENAIALGVLTVFGALTIGGVFVRRRSRVSGDWMIVVGVLPLVGVWWMIVPVLLALPVMVMAVRDTMRGSREEEVRAV